MKIPFCSKLPGMLIGLALVLLVAGVVLKALDYSSLQAANLLFIELSPSAFLRGANTTLFFSIALSLLGKRREVSQPTSPASGAGE